MGKKKGKKKKEKKIGTDVLNEVDKTFYEIQITDLNRKLARLKSHSIELEEKVISLEQQRDKTDTDRVDVINYLKRTLTDKTAEALELQDRVVQLETNKESDKEKHEEEIRLLMVEFENMREQLTSEIKLIAGKLNALEEFRMQRDDLMIKFQLQEQNIEEQELRHKRNLYEVERKFILGKDAIKREMEQQLFQLAKNFENANELRIAATTQRVIRENITINNELNSIISSSVNLQNQNDALESKNRDLTTFNNLLESERDKALKDYCIQKEIINQMVNEVTRLKDNITTLEFEISQNSKAEKELKVLRIEENMLKDKVNILEQKMHSIRCLEYLQKKDIILYRKQIRKLKGLIYETIYTTQTVLSRDKDDAGTEYGDNLLTDLVVLLSKAAHQVPVTDSKDTLMSATQFYKAGDVGLIPKMQYPSKTKPMLLNAESQVGPSFHEFLKQKEAPKERLVDEVQQKFEPEFEFKEESESSEETIISTASEIESAGSSKQKLSVDLTTIDDAEGFNEIELEELEMEYEQEDEDEDELSTHTI